MRSDRKKKKETQIDKWVIIDPKVEDLKCISEFSHRLIVVANCNTEEIIYSSLSPLGKT